MIWETIHLALQAIARNLLRSFLTVLGIVIGVAAVIALVTVGAGSSVAVNAYVESLGTDVLIVRPGQAQMRPGGARDTSPPFTLRDVEALSELSVLSSVAPSSSTQMPVVFGNVNAPTTVRGTTADYLDIMNWPVTLGRRFTESEQKAGAAVCILGETIRSTLFGDIDPVGSTIRLRNVSCRVVGLLQPKGASTFGYDQDEVILIPIDTMHRRIAGNREVPTIYLSLARGVTSERAIRDVSILLRDRRRLGPDVADDFNVTDMKQLSEMLAGINSVLTALLSSVAAISLLVGGIGIMNIMLVSVTERTREIGIRLAVGATARQVMTQFLVEALVLSLIGGILGVVLGLTLALVAAQIMSIPFSPSIEIIVLAFVFSGAVGMVFGYFPARRAARMDPIRALRHS